jgi:hypothetical protein
MKNSTVLIYGILTGAALFFLALFGLNFLFIAAEVAETHEGPGWSGGE